MERLPSNLAGYRAAAMPVIEPDNYPDQAHNLSYRNLLRASQHKHLATRSRREISLHCRGRRRQRTPRDPCPAVFQNITAGLISVLCRLPVSHVLIMRYAGLAS